MELYNKHRPKTLDDVLGQEQAVKVLRSKLSAGKMPHALMLTGPSGCGKTTIARIIATELKCVDTDLREVNAADSRGIDTVRDIAQRCKIMPMGSGCRVWILDEVHAWTSDAQSAMLKVLEDCPKHAYFILCTTDPEKLKETIHTRCTRLKLNRMSDAHLKQVVSSVLKSEKKEVTVAVVDKIVECAGGSARQALKLAEAIMDLDGEDAQLTAVEDPDTKDQAIDLVRALMARKGWGEVSKKLKSIEKEDAEGVRRLMIAYARSVLLGANPKAHALAAEVIEQFECNFYDSKHAGLALACYRIAGSKK